MDPKGFPTAWSTFCGAQKKGEQLFSFVTPISKVNRFAARFRVAKSLRGIDLEGIAEETSLGYAALCRVLLVYSTFETFLKITGGENTDAVRADLDAHGAMSLLATIRKADKDDRFFRFLQKHVNKKLETQLKSYLDGKPCNVADLAAAIRHIFAHGWLSPGADKCNPKSVAKICNAVCDFLLDFMDSKFSTHIDKGMQRMHGSVPAR